jgi:hypothetical protein
VKLLTILTVITYTGLAYYLALKPYLLLPNVKRWKEGNAPSWALNLQVKEPGSRLKVQIGAGILVWGAIVGFIVYNAWTEGAERFYSAAGYLAFILLGFIFSVSIHFKI